ncbi:hypothetical protein ACLOJK_015373 [Asimina triloba]
MYRCGKSCRLRWTNYLRPDLKHGEFSEAEEQTIVKLHSVVGNRWSLIAAQLPGRTDNDVKNHWNTKLKKKLSGMGIDPVTHKPFSHLMAEIATTLAPPQVAHLAEAALGCFKDEMLHLLTKKRIDFQLQRGAADVAPLSCGNMAGTSHPHIAGKTDDKDDTIQKIKIGLSKAMQEEPSNKPWNMVSSAETSDSFAGICNAFPTTVCGGFQYAGSSYGNDAEGSPWSQSMCTGSTCTGGNQKGGDECHEKREDNSEETGGGKASGKSAPAGVFNTDVLWDLSDDLMNPIV